MDCPNLMIFIPKFHIFEIMKGQLYTAFCLGWLLLSVQWIYIILTSNFLPRSRPLWWNFKLWQRIKVGILNNSYSYSFPKPKQLFNKDHFAVYNNTLWESLPLLPGQNIWRTLYNTGVYKKYEIRFTSKLAYFEGIFKLLTKEHQELPFFKCSLVLRTKI